MYLNNITDHLKYFSVISASMKKKKFIICHRIN